MSQTTKHCCGVCNSDCESVKKLEAENARLREALESLFHGYDADGWKKARAALAAKPDAEEDRIHWPKCPLRATTDWACGCPGDGSRPEEE